MGKNPDYATVLKRVSAWPVEDRIALARDVLTTVRPAATPRNTLSRALGIARGSGPAPTDEEVRAWIDEHRMEKYGR